MELSVRLILFASILGFAAANTVPDLPPDCDLENSEDQAFNPDQLKIINETEIQSVIKGLSGLPGTLNAVDKGNGGGCYCAGSVCTCWQYIYISSLHISTYAYLSVVGFPRCGLMYVQLQFAGKIYFRGYLGALHPATRQYSYTYYYRSTFTLEFYYMKVYSNQVYGCPYLRFRYSGHQYGLFSLGCYHTYSVSAQELAQIQQKQPKDVTDTDAGTVDDAKSFKDLSLEDVLLALKEAQFKGDEN